MLKYYLIFAAMLLIWEIQQITARHIASTRELETEETMQETSKEKQSVDLLIVQSGQEHFRL